jgi:hypothetical protein
MKRYQRNALWLVVTACILAGGSYGAWYAWDNGKIGDNPRAPTPHAMEKAVRFQAAYQLMMSGARQQPCLGLDSGSDTNDVNGIAGISPNGFPGQHAITLLLQTNVRNQQVRDTRIAQLDYFARQGLFTASDTTITTDDGVSRPARMYRITWKGYTHARTNYGSQLCFDYGRREYATIESIEKTLEKIMDLDVYEVSYKTAVLDIPAWAVTDEAKKLFPKLSDFIGEGSGKAKILRAKEGWQAAYEVEAEIGMAAKGAEGAQYLSQHHKRLKAQLDGSPAITLEEAKSLVAKHLADPDRAGRIGVPCLALNLQRGGDDKPDPAVVRDATDFVVTYFDRGDRKPYEYQQIARNLNILAALEHAGLAEMEIIRPAPPPLVVKPQALRRAAPAPLEPPKPVGIRYKVGREAASALGINGYGGGCIPAGRTKAEVLAVKPWGNGSGEANAQVYVRASIEQSPDWAVKIAEQLPALKAILDEGLPMGGQILKTPSGPDEGKWRLNGLTPHYPQMVFQTIPPHLKPLMPQTLAAMPVKAVKAPGLVFEPRTMPAPAMRPPGLVPMPSGPMPAPAAPPAPSADFSPAPAMVKVATPAPEPKKPATGPIFPADGSPVHVISIYQAPLLGGREREHYEQATGIANVSVTQDHATLLLLGHDSVEWRINVPSGVKLKRVVAAGSHDQRVVLSGGGKPQVSATRHELIDRQTDGALSKASGSYNVPYKSDPNSLLRMAEIAQFLTGSQPASFQGTYEAPKTGFAIDAKTPKFALAAPRAPGAVATTIILRAIFKEMINGYAVSRGRAGAFNAAWAEQTFSAGKGYFEGKARVVGSFSMHGYANIGMCPAVEHEVNTHFDKTVFAVASGEQSLYKDGDLFGVAADFDNQIAYFRVNGKWLNGAPGGGSGKRLQKGAEYRACVITSGTTIGGSNDGKQSNTGWEVNFGDKPFAHPLPPGYRPLQGGPTQT